MIAHFEAREFRKAFLRKMRAISGGEQRNEYLTAAGAPWTHYKDGCRFQAPWRALWD